MTGRDATNPRVGIYQLNRRKPRWPSYLVTRFFREGFSQGGEVGR